MKKENELTNSIVSDNNSLTEEEEYERLLVDNISIIKHIPHASVSLPMGAENYFKSNQVKCIYKMADIGVDDLFKDIKGIEIKAPYTRLFCDVERYKDNSKEEMYKLGQGYKYSKTYDGGDLIRSMDNSCVDWDKYIDKYYDEHHTKLTTAIKKELEKGKDVLLLDCHSYSDELASSLGKLGPFPDICIGINSDFDNEALLNLIIKKIKEKGYTYKINFPYEGSIMPQNIDLSIYKNKLTSIMIEVNKRLYL